ncbi:MAG TPA: hypothetical protein VMH87_18425 [Pseudomonadales bacterium]|nr:hypothetical protein [Pseudomonadales bacterium]
MRKFALIFAAASFLPGWVSVSSPDYIQGSIRITPPIHTEFSLWALSDGGTLNGTITDAKGRTFPVFIDHRLRTKTPGAIYLMAYPNESGSVLIRNEQEFKQKLDWH